jgi:hypothetical protein
MASNAIRSWDESRLVSESRYGDYTPPISISAPSCIRAQAQAAVLAQSPVQSWSMIHNQNRRSVDEAPQSIPEEPLHSPLLHIGGLPSYEQLTPAVNQFQAVQSGLGPQRWPLIARSRVL